MSNTNNLERKLTRDAAVIKLPWGDVIATFKWRNKIYVQVSAICKNIGIDNEKQISKLKNHPAFKDQLLQATPATIGVEPKVFAMWGEDQEFWAISTKGMFAWLSSINPNQASLRPEVVNKLVAYQVECMDVLEAYWQYGTVINPRLIAKDAIIQLHADGVIADLESDGFSSSSIRVLKHIADMFRDVYGFSRDEMQVSIDAAIGAGTNGNDGFVEFLRNLPPCVTTDAAMARKMILDMCDVLSGQDDSGIVVPFVSARAVSDIAQNTFLSTQFEASREDFEMIFWKSFIRSVMMNNLQEVLGDSFIDLKESVINSMKS